MAESQSYNGLLGLDKLPRKTKIVTWCLSFVFTIALSIYVGQYDPLYFFYIAPDKFPAIFLLICIVSVCLRLAGIRWGYILAFAVSTLLLLTIISLFGLIIYSIPYLD